MRRQLWETVPQTSRRAPRVVSANSFEQSNSSSAIFTKRLAKFDGGDTSFSSAVVMLAMPNMHRVKLKYDIGPHGTSVNNCARAR